ncbi:hydantoinase/oxoprolinase N-terminal domain-containing protein [Allosediminivita pacifica]|nr:hydantoinase/oxoprolinase N-terminal domain-containing protein [Allosediminivita pacifica]GGB22798.1 hypothetical protein GCM10011324_36040 [Allosediminivita pacifica]
MAWRIGIDLGGTLTDVCLIDEDTGKIQICKVCYGKRTGFGAAPA